MVPGHAAEFFSAFGRELNVLDSAIVLSAGPGDEAVPLESINDAGNVSVRHHELTREFGHR